MPALAERRFARAAEDAVREVRSAEADETDQLALLVEACRAICIVEFGGEPDRGDIVTGAIFPANRQPAIFVEAEILAPALDGFVDRRLSRDGRGGGWWRRIGLVVVVYVGAGNPGNADAAGKCGSAKEVEGEGIMRH